MSDRDIFWNRKEGTEEGADENMKLEINSIHPFLSNPSEEMCCL